MDLINAEGLTKVYRTSIKKPGLAGAFKGLFKSEFRETTAIDGISFRMGQGDALACIGENGAGKSTLIKMLVGILTPTKGSVAVSGFTPQKHEEAYLRNIGVIFGQKTNLWWDIPIIESYNAVQTLYKVPKNEFKETFDMIVELLGLAPILDSPARKVSLGQRMKADIGMVFLHRPSLLFLDEPTIGLDINIKYTIRKFIRAMNKEKGVSVLLTSHDLDDIEEICDDAMVLSKGKIVYQGALASLKQAYITDKVVRVTGRKRTDITDVFPDVAVKEDGHISSITYDHNKIPSGKLLEALNTCYEIDDITIQEPGIDSIVARIYAGEIKDVSGA